MRGHAVWGWDGDGQGNMWWSWIWQCRLPRVGAIKSHHSSSTIVTVRHAPLPSVSRSIHAPFSPHPSLPDLPAPVSPLSPFGTNSRTKRATRRASIAKGSPRWHSRGSVSSPSHTATWRPSESSVSPPFLCPGAHASLPQLPQSFPVRTLFQPIASSADLDTVRNSRPSPETGQSLPQMPSSACEFLLNLLLSMPLFVLPYLALILPAEITFSD